MTRYGKPDTAEDDECITSDCYDDTDDEAEESQEGENDDSRSEETYPLTAGKIASIVDCVEKAFKDETGKGNLNYAIDYACQNLQDTIDRLQRLKIKNTPWKELFNTDTFTL